MLKSKNKKPDSCDTIISAKSEIVGDLHISGGLILDGRIKGNIIADDQTNALVRISETGVVEGEIRVPNIVINGRVVGNVHSSQHIELAKKAIVSGDVNYAMMEMVMGAQVNGNLIHNSAENPRKGRKNADPVLSEVASEVVVGKESKA
jgi:cytoskeletal protein CcmA (bactofilin family)